MSPLSLSREAVFTALPVPAQLSKYALDRGLRDFGKTGIDLFI